MSRTYRFKHDEYMIQDELYKWVKVENNRYAYNKVKLDSKSKEGQRKIAVTRSGKHIMQHNGPSWFRREFSQVPYRRRAKRLIHQYIRGEIEDVLLESKPHREYWY